MFSVSPPGEILYSATLTVGEYDTGGPIVIGFTTGSAGSLEPPTFTFASTDITITTLAYNTPGSVLQLNAAIADQQALGSGAFGLYLDEAHWLVTNPASEPALPIHLSSRSLSWTNGQIVRVWLTVNREPRLTISGTTQVGRTLTATIYEPDGLPSSDQIAYQWIRVDGNTESDISGETGSTYTLVDADEGKTIKVWASYTDKANFPESATSRTGYIGDHEFNLRLNGQTLSWNPIGRASAPEGYDLSYEVQRREIFNGLGRNNDTWCHISPQWCLFTAHWAGFTFKGWADLNLHSRVIEYDLRVRAVFKARNGAGPAVHQLVGDPRSPVSGAGRRGARATCGLSCTTSPKRSTVTLPMIRSSSMAYMSASPGSSISSR